MVGEQDNEKETKVLIKIVDADLLFTATRAVGHCEICSYPNGYDAEPVWVNGYEIEEDGEPEFLCQCGFDHGSAIVVAA